MWCVNMWVWSSELIMWVWSSQVAGQQYVSMVSRLLICGCGQQIFSSWYGQNTYFVGVVN